MIGNRLPDGHATYFNTEPGDYWKTPDGRWEIKDPNGNVGALGLHKVTEHEDGTITVEPSILDPSVGGWHGYLEHGIWRQV